MGIKETQSEKQKNIWKYVKADNLFADYLPDFKSHKYKIRGKNSRDNPVEFSTEEKKQIKKAIRQMIKDMLSGKGGI